MIKRESIYAEYVEPTSLIARTRFLGRKGERSYGPVLEVNYLLRV
jgi:hypothetical protein